MSNGIYLIIFWCTITKHLFTANDYCGSEFWTIVPSAVEQSCHCLLENHTSDCWTIMSMTVEQSCQWMLNSCTKDCWKIVPMSFEQSYQRLLNNHGINCARDCSRITPATGEELWQWFLKNRPSNCWLIVLATGKIYVFNDSKSPVIIE